MADIVDTANDLVDARTQDELDRNRARLRDMPVGAPGECRSCKEHMPRLVNGDCAPCRDGL